MTDQFGTRCIEAAMEYFEGDAEPTLIKGDVRDFTTFVFVKSSPPGPHHWDIVTGFLYI